VAGEAAAETLYTVKEDKKGRTFLWESWDVGNTIPTSTQSASGIIQEERVGSGTGHRC
jgi:hypothetical protein